jgi:hypothetical protein
MKTRICILVTTAIAVLGGPATQVAGAAIPWDTKSGFGSSEPSRQPLATQKPLVKGKAGSQLVTFYPGGVTFKLKVGQYNPHAYVHGGAPANVAKAIVAAGSKGLQ